MRLGDLVKQSVSLGAKLTNSGALAVVSGKHTGRSPNAKKIVKDATTSDTVDWRNNKPMTQDEWASLSKDLDIYLKSLGSHLETRAIAGKDPRHEVVVDFYCENSTQKLFVHNMFKETQKLSDDILKVYCFPDMKLEPIVAINFTEKKIIISGTRYLGEIKKSVFTYMNHIMPSRGVLPMHCSVNTNMEGQNSAVFFGLSGTGKTTLSSSPDRLLLGDDEHGWSDDGLFNFESGCYAKTLGLSIDTEPEIFEACQKFGAILENVVIEEGSPRFLDDTYTQNGRASYPITHLPHIVEEGYVNNQPKNVVMLTCDASGVLPPVAKLSPEKAKKMFLAGYTSKVSGTEVGITEPQAVFSPCFGLPFMTRSPAVYGNLLEEFIEKSGANCWLVNTGWTGGPYGVGERISLKATRVIVSAILDNTLTDDDCFYHEYTDLFVPEAEDINRAVELCPENSWQSKKDYEVAASELKKKIEEKVNEATGSGPLEIL